MSTSIAYMNPSNRNRHNAETALVKVHNDILMDLDTNRSVTFILLDLSTAFDRIHHYHMLQSLENQIGIKATVLEFVTS